MCGIAGLIHFEGTPVSPVVLKNMTDAIAHRGPDGEGHWIEGNVGLGHRRLAIIDLSPAGCQPMQSADGRYLLTFNGEVYNFRELRSQLQALGHQFHSRTDSEVVLHALAEWGVKAVLKFNGMFALAFWDRKERVLLLARDRYGIKPLYTCTQNGTFGFASEQKALLARPEFKKRIDKAGLLEYFTFQNIFSQRSLLEGIHLLPAGHTASLDLTENAPQLRLEEYWDYSFSEPTEAANQEEYAEELDRLFQQAVNRQLVSDVELGSYLSGGLDSGSITAIASKSLPYLKSFTCGFDLSSSSGIELGFDERALAEYMSYKFKTEHYEMVLKAGDMERILPKVVFHIEEPRVGQSYPNYYAAQLASKFVKVVLNGAGGDELFAGYPWRYYRAVVNSDFEDYVEKYFRYWQRMLSDQELTNIMRPIWSDIKSISTRKIFGDVFSSHADRLQTPESYINHSLYFESKTFLHGLLVVEDKLSMAHGLETRVPFLDNDLVDFAMRCPIGLKLNNLDEVIRISENETGGKKKKFFERTKDGKQIFRDVMRNHVPQKIAGAEKKGFSAPDASWFKGESMDFVKRRLCQKESPLFEFLDRAVVHSVVDDHLSGRQNRRLLIWSLLSVDELLRQYEGSLQ